jgi:hypothetical protein
MTKDYEFNHQSVLQVFSKGDGAMYRADELEAAIDKYVESLDIEGLIDYVTHDLTQCYHVADSEIIDEFIQQMGVEETE